MICRNCGGEYDSSSPYCPYCKSENSKVAGQRKENMLEKLDREYRKEEQRLQKELPKKFVNRGTKYTVLIISLLLAVIAVIVIMVQAGRMLFYIQGDKQDKQQKEKLEQYFGNGDYENMSRYLNRIQEYDVSLSKYRETAQIYSDLERMLEMSSQWQEQMLSEWGKENPESGRYLLEYMLKTANQVFVNCEKWCEDSAVRDNEEVLEAFAVQAEEMLQTEYFLTDEQLERLKQEEATEEMFSQIADVILRSQAENIQ